MDPDDPTKLLAGHSLVITDDLKKLRLAQKHLDEILDIMRYANVTADTVVKSMLVDKVNEIRSGQKRSEPKGSEGRNLGELLQKSLK